MTGCEIHPIDQKPPPLKACSGKCGAGSNCEQLKSRLWVVAACEGMISLFEKNPDGRLSSLPMGEHVIAPSLEEFCAYVEQAAHSGKYLVLVGSPNDISWMRLSLPEAMHSRIVAEIPYPLLAAWFHVSSDQHPLAKSLEQILAS